jgi:thymidylate synthase (FAD)
MTYPKSTIIVELQEVMGSDRSISNAAWTSTYNKENRDLKTDEQVASVVKRLANDGHGTPFESVVCRFWIRMPIFTDRQHMTYRVASHNGLSGRYRTMPTDYFDVPNDVIDILDKAKIPIDTTDSCIPGKDLIDLYYDSCETSVQNYKITIDVLKKAEKETRITNEEYKRAREVVRAQLPQAGMTERTTIMNLRSLCNYFQQRLAHNAQPEIQQVAKLMLEELKKANVCPIAIDTLEKNGWNI